MAVMIGPYARDHRIGGRGSPLNGGAIPTPDRAVARPTGSATSARPRVSGMFDHADRVETGCARPTLRGIIATTSGVAGVANGATPRPHRPERRGKTTTTIASLGMCCDERGRIMLDGRLSRASTHQRVRLGIGGHSKSNRVRDITPLENLGAGVSERLDPAPIGGVSLDTKAGVVDELSADRSASALPTSGRAHRRIAVR